jgi:hypothetical protein
VIDYIKDGIWTQPPMHNHCPNCISWDIANLSGCKYNVAYPMPEEMLKTSPGYSLFHSPGRLTSELLIAGWNHTIDMFVHPKRWLQADVQKYLHQM